MINLFWTKRGENCYRNPKRCKTTRLDGFKLWLTLLLLRFPSTVECAKRWHHCCCSEWMLPRIFFVLSHHIWDIKKKWSKPDQDLSYQFEQRRRCRRCARSAVLGSSSRRSVDQSLKPSKLVVSRRLGFQ